MRSRTLPPSSSQIGAPSFWPLMSQRAMSTALTAPPRTEPRNGPEPVQVLPDVLDPHRVLLEQEGPEVLEHAAYRLRIGPAGRLAEPGEPVVGANAHEQLAADADWLHCRDLHRRPSYPASRGRLGWARADHAQPGHSGLQRGTPPAGHPGGPGSPSSPPSRTWPRCSSSTTAAATGRPGWSARWLDETPGLRLIQLPGNRGKGAAVKVGMLQAEGEYAFYADADLNIAPHYLGEGLATAPGRRGRRGGRLAAALGICRAGAKCAAAGGGRAGASHPPDTRAPRYSRHAVWSQGVQPGRWRRRSSDTRASAPSRSISRCSSWRVGSATEWWNCRCIPATGAIRRSTSAGISGPSCATSSRSDRTRTPDSTIVTSNEQMFEPGTDSAESQICQSTICVRAT